MIKKNIWYYARLEGISDIYNNNIDDFICNNSSILKNENRKQATLDWNPKIDKSWNPATKTTTYITCIRHKIHHPNNNLNTHYNNLDSLIGKAISDMISIIEKHI